MERDQGMRSRRTIVTPITTTTAQRILRNIEPSRGPRHDESREAQRRDIRIPMIPPIPPTVQIRRRIAQALPIRNLPHCKIIHRILHRTTHRPPIRWRDVPIFQPIRQRTTALSRRARRITRVVIVGRHDLGVGEHGAQRVCPVDAAVADTHTLDVGVGQDVVGVGTALGGAVPKGGAGIGHEAYVAPDVDQGAKVFFIGCRLDDVEERDAATKEVPQCKDVVVIGFCGSPKRVLACLVGRNDVHVVEGSIEQLEISSIAGVSGGDFGEHLGVPGVFGGSCQAVESGPSRNLRIHICAGLVGRNEGHTHPGGNVGRIEGVDDSKTRSGGHVVAGWIFNQCIVCVSIAQKGRILRWGRVEITAEIDGPFWCSVPTL